jgi:hypothetical protein
VRKHKYHNEKTEAQFDASNEVCLEVNAEKTKYTIFSRHQSAKQNRHLLVANKSFKI